MNAVSMRLRTKQKRATPCATNSTGRETDF